MWFPFNEDSLSRLGYQFDKPGVVLLSEQREDGEDYIIHSKWCPKSMLASLRELLPDFPDAQERAMAFEPRAARDEESAQAILSMYPKNHKLTTRTDAYTTPGSKYKQAP